MKQVVIYKQYNEILLISFFEDNSIQKTLEYCASHDISLKGAVFRGNDLSGLNLNQINLNCASFYSCNLTGASLMEANLRGASFYSCNLTSADLRWADLRTSIIINCNLRNAKKNGITFDRYGISFFGNKAQRKICEISTENHTFTCSKKK
jgi:Uncharacterized low-complexity proteins